MVREDLINSAVSFLQDPSVASAPLDKRIAFLQSKNLTQEEIDLSIARAGSPDEYTLTSTAAPSTPNSNYAYPQQPSYNRPPPQQGYNSYPPPQSGYWPQPPPPEPPKRDWRDWFIMATVTGGISYGLYVTAKRYIIPLIAPPTPPQLEQDKAAIDESFNKAFALLDQLATDTEDLKAAEKARTERLDTALTEVESVISELKASSRRREEEGRRISEEVRSLKDAIPKALDAQKESQDGRLKELGSELKSLKTLVGNRISSGGAASAAVSRTGVGAGANMYGSQGTAATTVNGVGAQPTPAPAQAVPTAPTPNANAASAPVTSAVDGQTLNTMAAPDRALSSSPYGRMASGRAATIPSWQMAAQKKNEEKERERKDTSESGTVVEAGAGA
ncbi:peroxisomal membrane anchor protein conserved region-domain-containing protein [Cryomyces antarcticus]